MTLLATLVVQSWTLAVPALEPGNEVTPEAIRQATFVQGEAPGSWKQGNIYILECWATWCGPCIAAIPHVDALYDKYHSRGLNVIGMNVMEDGVEKVRNFVEKKKDGMSYPVAYVGNGGPFEKSWMEPAGVLGIPHAFVVKDGRLLFEIHPALISEEMIESLLAGGEREKTVVDEILLAQNSKHEITALEGKFHEAMAKSDFQDAEEIIGKIEKLDKNALGLGMYKCMLSMERNDWDSAIGHIEGINDIGVRNSVASMLFMNSEVTGRKLPSGFLGGLARILGKETGPDAPLSPLDPAALALILYKLDKKPEAIKAAEKALRDAESLANKEGAGQLPVKPFRIFLTEIKEGRPMGLMDLMQGIAGSFAENTPDGQD